jgi:hypothetical protein
VRTRLTAALALLALAIAACGGGASPVTPNPAAYGNAQRGFAARAKRPHTANAVADPGFESGGFAGGWTRCGSSLNAAIVTTRAHGGTHSARVGSTAKPEVNGTQAVCQRVTVPAAGTLSFWVYEGTNDTVQYADQEADVLNSSGARLKQLYKEAANTSGWKQKSFDLSTYAGQSVTLWFGVKGNGWSSGYVYAYVDDVILTGSSASPSPSPSANPTATPSVKPSATPSVKPSATPTSQPTPTSAPWPCNDAQFLTDQQEFANGQITADQPVDVCGTVTQVLPSKTTSSGLHGYFYLQVATGKTIEIVCNLDEMNAPAWPTWLSTGEYAYVRGRYYYDNSSSQGIDWTHHGTSSSWPQPGYVVMNGHEYQ